MIPDEWRVLLPKPLILKTGQKWHVFLSYRSVNRGWVLNLYDVLTEIGFHVFLDQYVLKPGDSLVGDLDEGLDSSQAGVLIWSSAAADSDWVKNEYTTMMGRATDDKSFHFVPVKIERVKLPAFANSKLFVDFTDYPEGPNGGDLLRLVYGMVGKPLDDVAVKFAFEQDEAAGIAAVKISAAIRNGFPDKLKEQYTQGGLPWRTTASLACKAAEGLIKLGFEGDAISILKDTIVTFNKSIRPKQLLALALARRSTGTDLEDAQDILGELYAMNHLDPETMGLYGRTWMDRYKKSGLISELRQSRNYYLESFERSPDDYYTGINAASKSLLLGQADKAKEIAQKVAKLVGEEPVPGDYWKTATIGEAALILEDYDKAAQFYQDAIDIAPTEKKSHESTAGQAKLLLGKLEAPQELQDKILELFKTN
jgi:tetratricopeptide (TPR) repeat protein